jgi:hypothetical protein
MIQAKRLIPLSLTLAAAAVAWQGGVALVGLTDADAQEVAKNFFASSANDLPGPYFLKGPMAAQWKAKSPADRAVAVREMSLYAKRLVSSPAFAAAYAAWIKDRYRAVDHGIKIDLQAHAARIAADPDAAMKQMRNAMVASLAQTFNAMPPATLKMMFDQDMQNWKGDSEKARILSRAKQVAPLAPSKPDEFRKQYILLKSMDVGGPDTEAGLQAILGGAAKSQADQKAREEQQAFNDHKLSVELKRRLRDFVTLARSVDFAAQTNRRTAGRCS